MNTEKIGQFITFKRKQLNLSQTELAEKINTSSKTISKWETGICIPSKKYIDNLCQTLNISIVELLNCGESKSVLTDGEAKILFDISNRKSSFKDIGMWFTIATYINSLLNMVFLFTILYIISDGFNSLPTTNNTDLNVLLVCILLIPTIIFIMIYLGTNIISKKEK